VRERERNGERKKKGRDRHKEKEKKRARHAKHIILAGLHCLARIHLPTPPLAL
jgi:hypothetical protein